MIINFFITILCIRITKIGENVVKKILYTNSNKEGLFLEDLCDKLIEEINEKSKKLNEVKLRDTSFYEASNAKIITLLGLIGIYKQKRYWRQRTRQRI